MFPMSLANQRLLGYRAAAIRTADTIGPSSKREGESASQPVVVGLGRLELPTSRLSGVRSNQLSYRPRWPVEPADLMLRENTPIPWKLNRRGDQRVRPRLPRRRSPVPSLP